MAAVCKSCGAPLVWIETPAGKYMPCDEGLMPFKRDDCGRETVVLQSGEVIRCQLRFIGAPDGMARRPHWATCPQADKHRRGAKGVFA